jgi:hypothetical protein
MALVGRRHVLFAAEGDADRLAELGGHRGGVVIHPRLLSAEPAAHRRADDAHHAQRHIEQLADNLLDLVDRLGCQPDLHVAAGVAFDQRRMGFQVSGMVGVGREFVLENFVGLFEPYVQVPVMKPGFADLVAFPPDDIEYGRRLGEVLVDDGRIGQKRLFGIEDGRQLLVIDLDELQGLAGVVVVHGRYGGHLVADVPHLIAGEEGFIEDPLAEGDVGKVFARYDQLDAIHLLGFGSVDVQDARVGMRASQNPSRQASANHSVVGILGIAGYFRLAVEPGHVRTQYRILAHFVHSIKEYGTTYGYYIWESG